MARQVQIKPNDIPIDWSNEAADFVNRVTFYLIKLATSKETSQSTWVSRDSRDKRTSLA